MKGDVTYHYPGDKFVKRNKYSARSCKCWTPSHPPHQSILESDQCNVLKAMRIPYSIQYKVEIWLKGVHVCNHYIDFAIHATWQAAQRKVKPIRFIETKGYDTDLWKLKRVLIKAMLPKIPYEVLREKPGFYKAPSK